MVKKAGKATLDCYLEFLQNPNHTDLTKDQLNAIICMHGFRKLNKPLRSQVVESLSSIDRHLAPFRSTLKESVSGSGFMTMEEVVKDLCSLEWNECSVQSVETVGLVEEEESACDVAALKVGGKRKRRLYLKKLDALCLAAADGGGDCAFTPPASSSASHGSC